MNKPLIAILAGLGALVISWIYPPWIVEAYDEGRFVGSRALGFHCIFETIPTRGGNGHVRADAGRLLLIDLCIVAVTAGVVMVLRQTR